jgi:hypothetical protein
VVPPGGFASKSISHPNRTRKRMAPPNLPLLQLTRRSGWTQKTPAGSRGFCAAAGKTED